MRSVGLRVGVVGGAHTLIEAHVAGQCTEVVHNVVDAEVVAVLVALRPYGIAGSGHCLVERHLAHTVDGVVGEVHGFRHTVLGTLHHHAAAEDTAEVGTLDAVHQSAGIARAHTVLLPICRVGNPLAGGIGDDKVDIAVLDTFEQREEVVGSNRRGFRTVVGIVARARRIARAVLVGTALDTQIAQFVVGRLAGWQGVIGVDVYLALYVIVVSAIVGDVQASVAVDEGQVSVAVKTARMTRTECDEVAVVDVVYGGRGVAEHRGGVGVDGSRTCRRVTACEHGIVDDDSVIIQANPFQAVA